MKAAPFDYHRPESLAAALELLVEHGEDAKALAGGQSLIPLLAMRLAQPAVLVDLGRVPELRGVRREGGLRIGAMTRQSELALREDLPGVVASALPHIGHFQIRNRGTVGGSLAHMDPAAEWPALALLLDAELTLASRRGSRTLAAREFILGPLTTCLEADELLVEVAIPPAGGRFGFAEVERRVGDFALAGAACHNEALVAFATGPGPQRLPECERYLAQGGRAGPELVAVAEREIEAGGDIHASAAYRRKVGARLVNQVVEQAWS